MKPTFFERITGTISLKGRTSGAEEEIIIEKDSNRPSFDGWERTDSTEGELAVDVYQTDDTIVIQAMVAGVPLENLSVSVTREMVTIKGRRTAPAGIDAESYFHQELYWGAFSRTILLPAEVETDGVEATERRGLLTLKLPKIDKGRFQAIKIKSL